VAAIIDRLAGPHGTWQELAVPAREKDNP